MTVFWFTLMSKVLVEEMLVESKTFPLAEIRKIPIISEETGALRRIMVDRMTSIYSGDKPIQPALAQIKPKANTTIVTKAEVKKPGSSAHKITDKAIVSVTKPEERAKVPKEYEKAVVNPGILVRAVEAEKAKKVEEKKAEEKKYVPAIPRALIR